MIFYTGSFSLYTLYHASKFLKYCLLILQNDFFKNGVLFLRMSRSCITRITNDERDTQKRSHNGIECENRVCLTRTEYGRQVAKSSFSLSIKLNFTFAQNSLAKNQIKLSEKLKGTCCDVTESISVFPLLRHPLLLEDLKNIIRHCYSKRI